MKKLGLFIGCLLVSTLLVAQVSDFIVLKKRNNRTVKTYFPGSFIKATTLNGFYLQGSITKITNDSLFVLQQQVYQVPNQFGVSMLDTMLFTVGIPYVDIVRFDYKTRQKFRQVTLPRIMIIGGVGFAALELINTAIRGDKLNADNRLVTIGIAAGIAATGVLLTEIQRKKSLPGRGIKVVYVKMTD